VLGSGWRVTRGGARGGSLDLTLALALVAHFPRGLHLRDLRRTDVLTKVLTRIGEVRRGLAMKRWL
jgi:hypothetical protein